MQGPVYVGGGWNGEGLAAAGASPSLRMKVAEADAAYDMEAALERQEKQRRAEALQENAIAASVRMAEERGKIVSRHDRLHGIGRTRSEALAYYSALGDIEDRRREAEALRRFQEWSQSEQTANSGDVSAPSEIDLAELKAMREKAGEYRGRMAEARRIKAETLDEVWRRWISKGRR